MERVYLPGRVPDWMSMSIVASFAPAAISGAVILRLPGRGSGRRVSFSLKSGLRRVTASLI